MGCWSELRGEFPKYQTICSIFPKKGKKVIAGVGAPKVVINVHQTYILNRTLDVHKRT